MTREPNDYLMRWGLDDIGTLDQTAFETPAPVITARCFSVSFWFRATDLSSRQVLVNVGNRDTTQTGWSVFLFQKRLVLRANFPGQLDLAAVTPLSVVNKWHHFAGIIDRENRTLTTFLNGYSEGGTVGIPDEHLAPGADSDDTRLVIGGYTDAAGGHFDHTFGRGGTGLIDDFRLYARPLTFAEIASLIDGHNLPASVRLDLSPTFSAAPTTVPTTPVFVNGQEGYACYRIPAVVRAANGDLLAFAEGRLAGCSDSTPIIRLVCKRSRDNGVTWEPLQVVARNHFNDSERACMNPAPVVDTVFGSGRVIVVFNKMEFSEWDIVQGKGLTRVCCVFSDDNGRTWSTEKDITRQVHKPYTPAYAAVYPDAALPEHETADWRKHAVLPGHAIQLQATSATRGRLFYIGSYTAGDSPIFYAQNYAFWSDDLGQNWQISNTITGREDGSSAIGLGEAMSVELENGAVMVNSRNYQHGKVVGWRAVTVGTFDTDGNIRFQPVIHDRALVDSGVQASIIRCTRRDDERSGGKSRILFANPDHPRARVNMTVRVSYDEGWTWPVSKVIAPGPSAYSDMVIQEDMKIGLLYEQGNQGGIVYVNFSLDWLESGDGTDAIM